MGTPSFAFNEERMLAGIEAYRAEKRAMLAKGLQNKSEEPVQPVLTPPREAVSVVIIPPPQRTAVSDRVIIRTAKKFMISPESLLAHCNEPHFVRAREVVVFVLRRSHNYSLTRVGSILGRHHSTVLNAERNAQIRYESIPEFKELVDSMADMPITVKRDELGLPIEAA